MEPSCRLGTNMQSKDQLHRREGYELVYENRWERSVEMRDIEVKLKGKTKHIYFE